MPLLKHTIQNDSHRVFLETGTYLGDGVQTALDAGYQRVISIELSTQLHAKACKRFAKNRKVTLIQGDSETALAQAIAEIQEPITFWLDAHYSEGNTARGNQNTPLTAELTAIANHPVKTHTIMIDDVRCFGTEVFEGYPLQQALELIKQINPAYTITYVDGQCPNDVLIARLATD